MNLSLEHLQMEQTPLQRPREEKKSHSALTDRWLYGDANLGLKSRLCISAVGSLLGGLVTEMPHLPSGTEATLCSRGVCGSIFCCSVQLFVSLLPFSKR